MSNVKRYVLTIGFAGVAIGGVLAVTPSGDPIRVRPAPDATVRETAANIIVADLVEKTVRLFEDGKRRGSFVVTVLPTLPIPTGRYPTIPMTPNHFFYADDGGEAPPGGIGLKPSDAAAVFAFAGKSPEILIRGTTDTMPPRRYTAHRDEAPPAIGAASFLIADVATGDVLAERESAAVHPIASISKLMTALVADEKSDPEDEIEITASAMKNGYGNYGGFQRGQTFAVEDILYPLLMQSSNEAALALAEPYGTARFADEMNARASEFGMENTYFAEASGLSAENVSTAHDLSLLARELYMRHQNLLEITKLKRARGRVNNNPRAGLLNYVGGKNGYIDEAGQTTVAIISLPLSETEMRDIVFVLLDTSSRDRDRRMLTDWLTRTVIYTPPVPAASRISENEFTSIVGDLESVTITVAGSVDISKDTELDVLRSRGGNFSELTRSLPRGVRESDITIGMMSETPNPLFGTALRRAGFDMLIARAALIGNAGRLYDEGITPLYGATPYEVRRVPDTSISVGMLRFDGAPIPETVKGAAYRANVVIVSAPTAPLDPNAIFSAGADVILVREPGELRSFESGVLVPDPGNLFETGTVVTITISGNGKIKKAF